MSSALPTTGTSSADLVQKIFEAKERNRKPRTALQIEDKLRRLITMQRRANEIRLNTSRQSMRVWELP